MTTPVIAPSGKTHDSHGRRSPVVVHIHDADKAIVHLAVNGSHAWSMGSRTAMYEYRLVDSIEYGDKEFSFKSSQIRTAKCENGVWSHEIHALGIRGYGITKEASLTFLAEDFCACWDEIASERDEILSADAMNLKRRLIAAVREVVHKPSMNQ